MSLRIGLVTGEFPPMKGGVGAFTKELATALSKLGHEVHIITSREARRDGAQRNFWKPQEPENIGYAQLYPRVNRWWWSANSVIADIAIIQDLDLVNLQYQAAAYDMRVPAINFLPWRLREVTKTIVTFHDLRFPYLIPKAGRIRPWLVEQLARSAEGVIVTNAQDREQLLSKAVNETEVTQIPIGSNIEASLFTEEQSLNVRKNLGLTNDDLLLGYFGFLNPSKGADILLNALSQLENNTHLVFIGASIGSSDPGNQSYKATILEQITKLDLHKRVHWSGFLEDAELSAYFNAADLMVMPYQDGVSLRRGSLMAVLAHGRPLITTHSATPVPELVHGENVWLTPVDDPAKLRDAINQLADDLEHRDSLGRGAFEASLLFTWDKIAERTAQFFVDIIAKNS